MNVYIVRISIPVTDFRDRLRSIDGAEFIRELPPGRVVVKLPVQSVAQLTALEGVTAVTEDRLQRKLPQ